MTFIYDGFRRIFRNRPIRGDSYPDDDLLTCIWPRPLSFDENEGESAESDNEESSTDTDNGAMQAAGDSQEDSFHELNETDEVKDKRVSGSVLHLPTGRDYVQVTTTTTPTKCSWYVSSTACPNRKSCIIHPRELVA